MQSRVFVRSPHVCRIAKAAPSATRSMSFFPGPHFLTRGSFPAGPLASLEREVAPFFRMMDDISRSFDPFTSGQRAAVPGPFQPRFDIREVEGAYELRGELPGVESNNLEVEFTDPQTLVIRGRTESGTTSGTPPAVEAAQHATAAVEAAESTSTNAVADDAASTHSTSSYQKATVEDDAVAETATSTPGQATPAESTVSEAQQSAAELSKAQQTSNSETNNNSTRYWVSERRTGSFQRVFSFPTKIDQEAVKASLKNGVLNLIVPKAVAQQPKKIEVQ